MWDTLLTLLKLCSLDMVPSGSINSFQINGKEVIVINKDNQLFCLQGRCTHAGAPLVEGTVEGEILTCPWHGSKFRITNGEVVGGPAKKNLRVYNFTINNDFLFIESEQ